MSSPLTHGSGTSPPARDRTINCARHYDVTDQNPCLANENAA
jgi:hypothetical protein